MEKNQYLIEKKKGLGLGMDEPNRKMSEIDKEMGLWEKASDECWKLIEDGEDSKKEVSE